MTALGGWENFYVIVGSSAGALIGLQFVVITLIADLRVTRGAVQAGSDYTTPTVVHFAAVLFLAAIVSAPWNGIGQAAMAWGALGLGGGAYVFLVARRLRRPTAYQAVLEDWIFHVVLPFASYAGLVVAARAAVSHPRPALFSVAAAALVLLLVGIHNAWDVVTYHVFVRRLEQADVGRAGAGRSRRP